MHRIDPESLEHLRLPEETLMRMRIIPFGTRALRSAIEASDILSQLPTTPEKPQQPKLRPVEQPAEPPIEEDTGAAPDPETLRRYINMIMVDAA